MTDTWHHGGEIYDKKNIRLDYSVNINPLGFPDVAWEALVSDRTGLEKYPDMTCRGLREAMALAYKHRGFDVPKDHILCGNGASEIFQLLVQAIRPQSALITAPAFSGYEKALQNSGVTPRRHYLKENQNFRLTEAVFDDLREKPDMFFICQPNNPVGNVLEHEFVIRLAETCEAQGTYLVVDECFLEMTDSFEALTVLKDYGRYPQLILVSAFTKLYAMPGLRLGYAVSANEALLSAMTRCQTEWSVSVPAQTAGIAAISDEAYVKETRKILENERLYLLDVLRTAGFKVYPGAADFLFLRTDIRLYDELLKRGILIRHCDNYHGLDDAYYRIAIQKHENNVILAEALKDIAARRML